jgi:hypothetical protein
MARTTLRQLRALGLAWPPGPVDPPASEEETFDLSGEATGCESLYHDTKGDSRYLDQKALFEGLAKTFEQTLAKAAASTTRPITPRKLASLGLVVPSCLYFSEYPEAELDFHGVLAMLENDLKGDRRDNAVVRTEKRAVEALVRRLDELGVEWRAPAAVRAPPIEPPITRRKLEALGLEWPWPFPFDRDEPLDLARAKSDLTYGDIMEYTGGRGAYLSVQRNRTDAIIARLEELGVAWGGAASAPNATAESANLSRTPVAITRRHLKALGLALPFVAPVPFALDEPLDLEDLRARWADGVARLDEILRRLGEEAAKKK